MADKNKATSDKTKGPKGIEPDFSSTASIRPSTSEHNNYALSQSISTRLKRDKSKYRNNVTENCEEKKFSNMKSKTFRSKQKESENEEKKVLNMELNKDMLLNAIDTFEIVLHHLANIGRDEEVYERLLKVQEKIEIELSSKKILNEKKKFQNLRPSKSVASSMQSLCSASSNLEDFDESDTCKEFMSRVNCPFCLKEEPNKVELIKHVDENCLQLQLNVFKEKNFIPYAVCQILPNNTLKCNICQNSVHRDMEHFFIHSQTELHVQNYTKMAKTKEFTDFLFCSVCKTLVPNNYTQFHHHITNRIHIERSKLAPAKYYNYSKKGINCVYTTSKTFKCLDCPEPCMFKNSKDVLKHFEGKHSKCSVFPKFFCEFCNDNIHIYEVISHFNSEEHKIKEQLSKELYELCSYCAFTCKTLSGLALHMTKECQELNRIRIENQNLTKVEANVNDSNMKENLNIVEREKNKTENKPENESSDDVKITGDKTKETPYIIIKGNTGLPELYKYFKGFGEITTLEFYKGENVLIQFRERRAVQDILLLQGLIKINGEKIEILTDESMIKSDEERKKVKQLERSEASSGNAQQASLNDKIKNVNDDNDIKHIKREPQIESLFSRASCHLHERSQRCDGSIMRKILQDCPKPFGKQNYSLVGFVACELSFPVENINFYCKMSDEFKNVVSADVYSALSGAIPFQKNLIKKLGKFFQCSDWEEVWYSLDSVFPYIASKHKKTQRTCTFTCVESAKVLTDMLSHCTKKVVVQRFCLVVRLWLAVHELKIREFEYVIISILVFFLLNLKDAEPFMSQTVSSHNIRLFYEAVNEKVGPFEELKSLRSCYTVGELFSHFLNFLLKFDFEKYAICLPIPCPVPKTLFETSPFASYLDFLDPSDLKNSSMCVLDPHLTVNLASGVLKKDLKSLLEIARRNFK